MSFHTITKSFSKVLSIFAVGLFLVSPLSALAAGNIAEVASSAPQFSTLVAAVKAAGLVDTLSGTGPFTVLAPTNDAFAKLPSGLLEKLLLPANKAALIQILKYHVVSGKSMAADVLLLNNQTITTVEGSKISVKVNGNAVVLNGNTNITATDIAASNGVIHQIDQVLVPSSLDLKSLASAPLVRTGGNQLSKNSLYSIAALVGIVLIFGLSLIPSKKEMKIKL